VDENFHPLQIYYIFFTANHLYKAGKTRSVNIVEVKRPPTTTVASGFCTSLPVPVAINKGINPKAVVAAVIKTGRIRNLAPSIDASSIDFPSLIN
jgi:hypothetical protein